MKLALLLAFLTSSTSADVVLSMRYFQAEGTSHYHLFLYGDDGKLLRQLTQPEDAHDVAPLFSKDGRFIFFTRLQGERRQTYRISVNGQGLRRAAPPAGYAIDQYPTAYVVQENTDAIEKKWLPHADGFRMSVTGSTCELLLREDYLSRFSDHEDLNTTPHLFLALALRDSATGAETCLPVGEEYSGMFCNFAATADGNPFLQRDGLHVAFFYQHTGSSDSFRIGAIDLLGRRIVSITDRNPAVLVPHGTRPGFFSICSERYQHLPGAALSVNCLYLDWWNKDFQRTRFADRLGLFGGASIRVKGQPMLQIPYDKDWSRGR